MNTEEWKKERIEVLKQNLPIVQRIVHKFPPRYGSIKKIEKETGRSFKEIWQIFNELGLDSTQGVSEDNFSWRNENFDRQFKELKIELNQLEGEFKSESIWEKWKIREIIVGTILLIIGYLIGKFAPYFIGSL